MARGVIVITTHDPHFAFVDHGGEATPRRPASVGSGLRPVCAINGIPDVVVVAVKNAPAATKEPHLVVIDNRCVLLPICVGSA